VNLVVISHKPCWMSTNSISGYVTDGGFPLQMAILSELFDQTTLLLPVQKSTPDAGMLPLTGSNLRVRPLGQLPNSQRERRLYTIPWLALNSFKILNEIMAADAVHIPIPGDIGTIGMLLAQLLQKPLFVRHCGNWDRRLTLAERFWRWYMERYAGGKRVFMATGESPVPPSQKNPNIQWIFSTSLSEKDIETFGAILPKQLSNPVRLITVGRQESGKNTGKIIRSIPLILNKGIDIHLDVVGTGTQLVKLQELAIQLKIENRVKFHGRVDHHSVFKLLQNADIFCFPTDSEGFPKAVVEALACGLPVIATPVSVLPNLIGDSAGIILRDKSEDAIAKAVIQLCSDRANYSRLSLQAKLIARNYSLERWSNVISMRLSAQWGDLKSYVTQ